MKFRKLWVIAVALLLVLTACGGSGNEASNSSATTGSGQAEGSQQPDAGDQGAEQPEEKPTLKSLQRWYNEDFNTYPVAKMLEERTGYKVEYEMLPQDKPQEKLSLLIGSGEKYDAVTILGSPEFKALYLELAQQNALTDLTPLLEEHGPNLLSGISEESWNAVKVDGKIYAIPSKTIEFVATGMMVRLDWLEKLNLDIPETLDEFVAVLKAFKEQDPGGNGANNIPLVIKTEEPFVPSISGAFGLINQWNEHDGKLVSRVEDPRLADYLTFMNQLFADKLLDQEFGVTNDATMKEKFSSGRAGFAPLHWADIPPMTDTLQKLNPEAKIAYIPALKGPDGTQGYPVGTGFDLLTFIPKTSDHAADAIKWMNAKLDKDTFKLMAIGEEGVHHTYENGQYKPILPIFNDERNLGNAFLTGMDESVYPTYWQARVRKDMRLYEGWEYLNLLQPDSTRVRDLLGFAPYLPEYNKNFQKLNVMLNDYVIKVIFGAESLASIDDFVAKYDAEGGKVSAEEINAWYAN